MRRVMRRRVMGRRPSGPSQSTGRSRGRSTQGRADMMRRLAAQRRLANRSSPKSAQGNLPQGKSKLVKSTRTPAQIAEAMSRFQKTMSDRRKLPTRADRAKADQALRDRRKLPTRVSTPNSGTKRLGTPIPPSQKGSKVLKANVSPTTPTRRKPPRLPNELAARRRPPKLPTLSTPRKKTVTKRPNVDARPPRLKKANVSPTTPTTRRRPRPKNVRSLRSMVGAARRRRLI